MLETVDVSLPIVADRVRIPARQLTLAVARG
jgi:hypothetical protein